MGLNFEPPGIAVYRWLDAPATGFGERMGGVEEDDDVGHDPKIEDQPRLYQPGGCRKGFQG